MSMVGDIEAPADLNQTSAQDAVDSMGADTFDSIADFIESEFETAAAATKEAGQDAETVQRIVEPVQVQETSPEMVEMGVEMYVEILETVSGFAARIYSGDTEKDFLFDKKLKERYKKITEIYAKTQNITVSPGAMFAAFTLLIVSQVGYAAHVRKQEVLRAAAFRKKVVAQQQATARPSKQLEMFPVEHEEKSVVLSGAGYEVPDAEKGRKDYSTDQNGYYKKTPDGEYLKQSDRKQKPSAEIQAFILDFYSHHLQKPNNKQIKAFLRTL